MPKISELDNSAALTGDELVDVVQNGVNVKVALKALMNAPREVSVSNTRWMLAKEDDGFYGVETPINETEIEVSSASGGGGS